MSIANILVGIFAIGVGTITLLAGHVLFRVILPVLGFLIGFVAGAGLGELIFGSGTLGVLLAGLLGLVFGVGLALLSWYLYTFGILLIAVFFGAGLFASIMLTLGFEPASGWVVASAMIGGLLAALLVLFFKLEGAVIAVITAAIGAAGIVVGLGVLLNKIPVSVVGTGEAIGPVLDGSFIALLIWLGLMVAGSLVQITITAPKKLRPDPYGQNS